MPGGDVRQPRLGSLAGSARARRAARCEAVVALFVRPIEYRAHARTGGADRHDLPESLPERRRLREQLTCLQNILGRVLDDGRSDDDHGRLIIERVFEVEKQRNIARTMMLLRSIGFSARASGKNWRSFPPLPGRACLSEPAVTSLATMTSRALGTVSVYEAESHRRGRAWRLTLEGRPMARHSR